jgi:hypothetical protein
MDLLNKVVSTAKSFRLQDSINYKSQGPTELIYESVVAKSDKFPKNLFLINKKIIFNKSIEDSKYDVFKFDGNGKYSKMENNLNKDFFKNLNVLKRIV